MGLPDGGPVKYFFNLCSSDDRCKCKSGNINANGLSKVFDDFF